MKSIFLTLMMVVALGASAKTVTKQILVKGECGMCKEKIEKALDMPGVSFAEWNVETKMLTVRYNDKKVSEDKIHETISGLGYATDKLEANKDGQNKLESCCKPKEVKKCGSSKGCCTKKS
jgi:periplasmic mercuric ion binding protein